MRPLNERRLRRLVFGFLLVVAGSTSAATDDSKAFRAGVTRMAVQDTTSFDALIAYPTEADEAPIDEGIYNLSAGREAPIAGSLLFPIILFSHGSGRGPGTPLVHGNLLLHLARAGFVVVAPFHPGTPQPFVNRPRQMRRTLDAVLSDPRFTGHVDANRIGVMGFSFGGAVVLIVAGAMPDLPHLSAYCRDHPDDPRACDGIPTDGSWANVPKRKS
jgi:predicted dienelactone hydrolase